MIEKKTILEIIAEMDRIRMLKIAYSNLGMTEDYHYYVKLLHFYETMVVEYELK